MACAAALVVSTLLLNACSSRDTVLAEKVAAADAAALRAENAAVRAEKAAGKVDASTNKPAAVQVDAEPEDLQDPAPGQDPQVDQQGNPQAAPKPA